MTGTIKRQGAHVYGLPGLVDGLLSGQQNGGLLFKPHLLREFGGADGRVHRVAHGETAGESRGEAELGLRGAALVQAPGEQQARTIGGSHQLDAHGSGSGDHVIFRIGDDDADGGGAPGEIGLLTEDVDHGRAQNLRDGFGGLGRRVLLIGVEETIADAVPDEVVEGRSRGKGNLLAPGTGARSDVDVPLSAPQDAILGIQDFDGELAGAGVQAAEGNGDAQGAAGVGGRDPVSGRCLGIVEGLEDERGGDGGQYRQEEKGLRRLVHRRAPSVSGMGRRLEDWTAKAGKEFPTLDPCRCGMPRRGRSFQGGEGSELRSDAQGGALCHKAARFVCTLWGSSAS